VGCPRGSAGGRMRLVRVRGRGGGGWCCLWEPIESTPARINCAMEALCAPQGL
jgi:hypothetical protein